MHHHIGSGGKDDVMEQRHVRGVVSWMVSAMDACVGDAVRPIRRSNHAPWRCAAYAPWQGMASKARTMRPAMNEGVV